MNNIQIRKAIIGDVLDIINIGVTTFKKTFITADNESEVVDYVRLTYKKEKITKEINESLSYFVLLVNDKISGFILLSQKSPKILVSDKYLMVERLYIDTTMIDKGLGSRLLHHAEIVARDYKVNKIWLEVLKSNEKAVLFYEKHGYITFHTAPGKFLSDGSMDLWMYKSISPSNKSKT